MKGCCFVLNIHMRGLKVHVGVECIGGEYQDGGCGKEEYVGVGKENGKRMLRLGRFALGVDAGVFRKKVEYYCLIRH